MKKMAKRWVFLATILLLADLTRMASAACVTTLQPGNDLNAAVQACPAGTTFHLSPGTYRMQTVNLTGHDNDQFIGAPGNVKNLTTILNGSLKLTSFTRQGNLWVTQGLRNVSPWDSAGDCDANHPSVLIHKSL